MNTMKFIICIITNIILFSLFYLFYNDVTRNQDIIKTEKPIKVKVLDVTYSAKSTHTCKVEFNNKVYKDVPLPPKVKNNNNYNNKDFYYDIERDLIFYKNEKKGALYVAFFMSFLSLFLWFIPKEKFKW